MALLDRARVLQVLALANAVGAATAMGTGAGRNVASPSLVMELLRREVRALASTAAEAVIVGIACHAAPSMDHKTVGTCDGPRGVCLSCCAHDGRHACTV